MRIKVLLVVFIIFIYGDINGQNIRRLSSRVPIGTIVAWSGVPAKLPKNWKVCDGSQISKKKYPQLCSILEDNWGVISGVDDELYILPNLQGIFLRGVNQDKSGELSDPDARERVNIHGYDLSIDKSNQVGSYQNYTTAKPKKEFKISNSGDHEHIQQVRRNDNAACGAGGSQCSRGASVIEMSTSGGGKHSHVITEGGDKETRPANAYVYWIIKVK